jgi:4-hydroxy-tetrahydrodipicolinate synthase
MTYKINPDQVEMGLAVRDIGLAGIAATPPYYYPCAQDELLAHYRHIRERVRLPLWVYNIPVTVKTVVEPATVAQLAGEGTVVGLKDSSGAGELLAQLNIMCEQGGIELLRFLGTVYRVTITRAIGAHGVIPGIANVAAATVAGAWEAGEAGDPESVREHEAKIVAATKLMRLAKGGSPDASRFSGMKSALKLMGVIEHDTVSRPLRPLTEEEKRPITAVLRELGLVD